MIIAYDATNFGNFDLSRYGWIFCENDFLRFQLNANI